MKSLVSDLILRVQGTFENDRKCSIRSYKVSGTTVKQKLFATDKTDRYFHIYYDDGKKAAERENFENRIDRMGKKLTQKAILKAFDMTAENVQKQAQGIASDLARIRMEAIEEATANDELGGI